jgi:glycosyltransferase involved in cell wall biosynthesis
MNIFVIPSWYPTQESPVTGRFFKEQAILYANGYKQDNLAISRWGQGEFIIDLMAPLTAIKKLFRFISAKKFENSLAENVAEFYTPAVEIRPRKYAGDLSSILNANISNFQKAQHKYGNIDIVHAHVSFPAGFIAAKIAQTFNIPYVLTEHMGPFPFPFYLENGRLLKRLQIAFLEADRVIAVSNFLKNEMSRYDVITDEVIPDFIDDDFFSSEKRASVTGFVFFALGRIAKEKGIDVLLKAFAIAHTQNPNMVLKIGGIGADMQEMMDVSKRLGIDDNIEWLGELDVLSVKTNLQECDVFITASTYETFGVVVSEALCCGKPIISTMCGGPEDMLEQTNSVLVPIGDASAMAAAMCKIEEEIQNFDSTAIRSKHISEFGKNTVTAKLREVYLSILRDD